MLGRCGETTDFLENANGDLQLRPGLLFLRFARSVQAAKNDGVAGQNGSLLEQRPKGRIQRGALAAEFVQVVGLPEAYVVE